MAFADSAVAAATFENGARSAQEQVQAPAPARYRYLMSKPVPMDVHIGAVGMALHYTYWASEILFKTGLAYAGSHHAAPTLIVFLFTLAHSAPYLTAHSMADLKVRQAIKSSWLTRKLRDIPGIQKATILSSGALKFEGPIVRDRKSQNYIFVETDEPLKPEGEWLSMFGAPIDVTESAKTKIKFRLVIDGHTNGAEWEAPLADILDKKAIPTEIADQWREDVKGWDKQSKEWTSEEAREKHPVLSEKLPSLSYVLGRHNQAVQVNATVTLPSGEEIPIDSMIAGGQVRKLLGMGLLQRVKDYFVETFTNGELVEHSVALDVKRFPLKQCEALLQGGPTPAAASFVTQ